MTLTGLCIHISATYIHISTHGNKTLNVLVNGTPAHITSAGQRHFSPAKTAEQRANEIIAGTDFPPQFIGNLMIVNMGTVHVHRGAVNSPHFGAQFLENI